MPEVISIGKFFLHRNQVATRLYANHLEKVDDYFLYNNMSLTEIFLPALKEIKISFLDNSYADYSNLCHQIYNYIEQNRRKILELNNHKYFI